MNSRPGLSLSLWMAPLLLAAAFAQAGPDWTVVERALGRTGKLQGSIYKIGFPRTDLHVRIGRTLVDPHAFFVHFWAEGKSEAVAKALRAARDRLQ
jgi:hypothetical protein